MSWPTDYMPRPATTWRNTLFAQLVMYDHHEPRYMKGLAAATADAG